MASDPVLGDPMLVMVPGLGLQASAWGPTAQGLHALRGGADVSIVQLPGYGERARRREPLAPEVLGARLAALLPADRPVALCGHSASCQVVAHAAVRRPGAVVGLVLVGPTTDPRAATWRGLVGRWLATARHEEAWQVPTLARQYSRTGLVTMGRAMEEARRDRIEATLDRTECPVLLLRGAEDHIAPEDWLARLAAYRDPGGNPRGERRLVTLPTGGHMVPLTHGHLVAEAVAEFLSRAVRP